MFQCVSLSHCVMDGLGQSIDRMSKNGLSPCSNVSLSHCVMDGLGQSIDRMRKHGLSQCVSLTVSWMDYGQIINRIKIKQSASCSLAR